MARREKTEVRRHQIMEASLALLAETSLESLSTRAIARAVGLTQPGLFRHFRSRDEILLAVIQRARERLAERVQGTLETHTAAVSRLGGVVESLLGHVEESPGLPRLLFADAATTQAADAPVRAALRHLMAMQRNVVGELVRAGQREGALSAAVPADQAAAVLIGAIQGLILQWELEGHERPLVPRGREALALWMRGAAPRPGDGDEPHSVEPPPPTQPDELSAPQRAPAASSRPPSRLSVLDVRPFIERGHDPLREILAAVEAAGPESLTCVIAPFAPRPLVTLLSSRGYRVTLRPLAGAAAGPAPAWAVEISGPDAPAVLALEDSEPPEPLQRVLEASASLAEGAALVARVPREPHLLYPRLRERGLAWETVVVPETTEALVRVERRARTAARPHETTPPEGR